MFLQVLNKYMYICIYMRLSILLSTPYHKLYFIVLSSYLDKKDIKLDISPFSKSHEYGMYFGLTSK